VAGHVLDLLLRAALGVFRPALATGYPVPLCDPAAMAPRVRSEERFAEEVLRRFLGAEVTARDDGSSDRMADALFTLPDGTEGALEVTTIGDRAAQEQESLAAKTDWRVEGATWAWMIHIGHEVIMRDLKQHLPTLVLTCESCGSPDPLLVPSEFRQNAAFCWLRSNEVSMHGFAETSRPGAIDVLPDGGGGVVFEHQHLDEISQWLSARLREPDLAAKIHKLMSTDRAELHLFVRIHEAAMPFSLYYPLAWGNHVPNNSLDAPEGLTGLWLAPQMGEPNLVVERLTRVGPR
jgi:hypothetical protein